MKSEPNPCREILCDDARRRTLIVTVAKRLRRSCVGIDAEERRGWAGLGLAKASQEFDPSRFTGESRDATKRLSAYLLHRGLFLAIDAVRSARMAGRFRGKKFYPVAVEIEPLPKKKGECGGGNFPDEKAGEDPTPESANASEIVGRIREVVRREERQVFEYVYVEGMTMADAARQMGLTPSRMQAVHERLLEEIHGIVSHD